MIIKELIEKLQQFPEDMEVYDSGHNKIDTVREATWTHTNYPYDKLDKQIVIIE